VFAGARRAAGRAAFRRPVRRRPGAARIRQTALASHGRLGNYMRMAGRAAASRDCRARELVRDGGQRTGSPAKILESLNTGAILQNASFLHVSINDHFCKHLLRNTDKSMPCAPCRVGVIKAILIACILGEARTPFVEGT